MTIVFLPFTNVWLTLLDMFKRRIGLTKGFINAKQLAIFHDLVEL